MSVTAPGISTRTPSLVLSIFPGADLLGRGFEAEGYCVVRGPEKILGGDVREFHALPGRFDGVIGGPPCQLISRANRSNRDPWAGCGLVIEFLRVVREAQPCWWLMENVHGLPDLSALTPDGYQVQRFTLNPIEFGYRQNRPRVYLFGYSSGYPLVIDRVTARCGPAIDESRERCCMATEANRKDRRDFPDFCELQGLPRTFNPAGLSVALKYRIVGNGVHVGVSRVIAGAIRGRPVTPVRLCVCGCGQTVRAGVTLATAACRKRMQRRRDAAAVENTRCVTPELCL